MRCSEAGSGSDAFALKTRAVDKGDITNSPVKSSGSQTATRPRSLWSLRRSIPKPVTKASRLSSSKKVSKDFRVGKKEDKLGIRASSTTELILDNCKVPKENVLGDVGKGYKVSIETLNEGRIGIGHKCSASRRVRTKPL